MLATFRLLTLILTWLTISCSSSSKEIAPVIDPPVIDTTPGFIQYGTPFNNVTLREDASIYQVNIRAFSEQGNFAGVMARLDSIKALGINVLYLMPTFPLGQVKAINSPYCIRSYTGINPEFGTMADLRALVDAAHNRDMSVLLDWVANHTSWDHEWITSHKDWYLQDAAGNIVSPPGTGWNDVAQLNFSNAAMRLEMIRSMQYWIYEANVDGFRCDYADGPPVDFWKQAIDTLRNITTHKLLILAEGDRSENFFAGFDYNFGFEFYGNMVSIYNTGQPATSIQNLNELEYQNATGSQQVVRYITNHDVNGSHGTPLELFDGTEGSMAAFVVAACMKSVPMIYSGQEVAFPSRITFPFTSININWNIHPEVTAAYKKVLQVRNEREAIRRGTLSDVSTTDVCAFYKEIQNDKVYVICNLRDQVTNYDIPVTYFNTNWSDLINGGNLTLGNTMTLQPYQYIILGN